MTSVLSSLIHINKQSHFSSLGPQHKLQYAMSASGDHTLHWTACSGHRWSTWHPCL